LLLDAQLRIGDAWRKRWNSLRLFTPAQHSSLPGLPFPGPAGSFPAKEDMADYLENYARRFDLPIALGTRVERVTRQPDRMLVECEGVGFASRNVIIAGAGYSRPKVPDFAGLL